MSNSNLLSGKNTKTGFLNLPEPNEALSRNPIIRVDKSFIKNLMNNNPYLSKKL